MNLTQWVALWGALTGTIAIVVGIWNLYRAIDRDKVKLRVGISWAMSMVPNSPEFLAISVTILSQFPVTVREAGIRYFTGERAICLYSKTANGERLPIRMESRTALSIYFPPEFMLDPRLKAAECAYVSTDCGETFKAGHLDLARMVAEAQNG